MVHNKRVLHQNIFLFSPGSISSNGGVTNPQCGGTYSIPNGEGASFFCRPSMYGQYVTIINTANENNVALTLCEVEVYSERRGKISFTLFRRAFLDFYDPPPPPNLRNSQNLKAMATRLRE